MTEKYNGILPLKGKRLCLKRIRCYDTGEGEVEVGTLFLGNEKNNVIADKVLSYF